MIEIYTTRVCPYCDLAKSLLKRKGFEYQEVDVSEDMHLRQEMMKRSEGYRTVPQIFIHGKFIGGYDQLALLNEQGELDILVKKED